MQIFDTCVHTYTKASRAKSVTILAN